VQVNKSIQTAGIANFVRSLPIACLITEKIESADRSTIGAGKFRRDTFKSTAIINLQAHTQKYVQ